MAKSLDVPCVNCGEPQSSHFIVNFSDGPCVSIAIGICPDSVYRKGKIMAKKGSGKSGKGKGKGGC